jgi:hypothetical protein
MYQEYKPEANRNSNSSGDTYPAVSNGVSAILMHCGVVIVKQGIGLAGRIYSYFDILLYIVCTRSTRQRPAATARAPAIRILRVSAIFMIL